MRKTLETFSEPTPFDRMVQDWEGQILARYYGVGEVVGDETMELYAASLELDEQQIEDAFLMARSNVEASRRQ